MNAYFVTYLTRFASNRQHAAICIMYHELKLKCSSKTTQSSAFAAHIGLYVPSIKCHWEIEGAEGPQKTEPNEHDIPCQNLFTKKN